MEELGDIGADNRDLDFLRQILEDQALFKIVDVSYHSGSSYFCALLFTTFTSSVCVSQVKLYVGSCEHQ